MTFDATTLLAFAAELERSPHIVSTGVRPVVEKGAVNVKNDFNDSFTRSKHFKGNTGSVNYDLNATVAGIEAEIGPDKGRYPGVPGPGKTRPAAPLANIAIFGGARGGGTVDDPQKHLDAEEPRFTAALAAVVMKTLGR